MAEPRPRRLVVISDFCDGMPPSDPRWSVEDFRQSWLEGKRGPAPATTVNPDLLRQEVEVCGGYLERLPLASIRQGLCDEAEIWTLRGPETDPFIRCSPFLCRRSFRAEDSSAPFSSNDMLGHIAAFGSPDILCVWGLGVDEAMLRACADSVKIYNSIDAPALRIPADVSRYFDLVLTGADWQSEEVDMATVVMPIGPEFASPETFFPIGSEKNYEVIYVAAAQAYKRHDVLFNALAKLPRSIRALCVCGYGELGEVLRQRVAELDISVEFTGPPGVSFMEVNRLMNQARVGVVCGVDDGAPAILTEYMLAGLPVLANADLRCGLQYITPATGRTATEGEFHLGILDLLSTLDSFRPRETVIARWSWLRTAKKFADLISEVRRKKEPRDGTQR